MYLKVAKNEYRLMATTTLKKLTPFRNEFIHHII